MPTNFSSKKILKRVFIIPFLTVNFSCLAQSPTQNVSHDQSLWIKGTESIETKSEFSKNQQKEYFNFNPIYESDGKPLKYKRIIENKYSLFAVFRSDLENETEIITLKTSEEKTVISNRKVGDDESSRYKDAKVKDGMILSYFVNTSKKIRQKGNALSIVNLSPSNSSDGSKNELMEFLYYPKLLNKTERKQVDSYLSIKYGISLLGKEDYLNSDSKKIWDFKKNEDYNNRVTGIGRDDYFNLFQKQSGNSSKDGLYIGLKNIEICNQFNKNTIPNKTFLLWGDNKGTTILKNSNNPYGNFKQMKRVWKMQASASDLNADVPTQVVLDKKTFGIKGKETVAGTDEYVWLVVTGKTENDFDFSTATFYKAREDENQLIFDNVYWDKDNTGSDLFTFIKAPDFFITYASVAPDCNVSEPGKINVSITGGNPPFDLIVSSDNYKTTLNSNERFHQFAGIPEGTYSIIVKDNFQSEKTGQLQQDIFKNISISLDPQWQLTSSGSIKVYPNVQSDKIEELAFMWKHDDLVISTEKELETDKAGDYQLTVTNKAGCAKELTCRVRNYYKAGENSWFVYPNPIDAKQPFTINFDLEKSSDVTISYYDISSRLIKTKNLGQVQRFDYSDSLSVSGTYMIVVVVDGKTETSKLIIK